MGVSFVVVLAGARSDDKPMTLHDEGSSRLGDGAAVAYVRKAVAAGVEIKHLVVIARVDDQSRRDRCFVAAVTLSARLHSRAPEGKARLRIIFVPTPSNLYMSFI